jgi:SAM-dependent methyltransferase
MAASAIERYRVAATHRAKWLKKVAWKPVRGFVRGATREAAAELGGVVLPPWRCPGCGSRRKRRRLARCGGVVGATLLRQRVYATGCPRCGLLYATPRPTDVRLETLYAEDGEWAASHSEPTARDTVAQRLIREVHRATGVCAPAPGSQVLDFGCGRGRWLNSLAAYGWTTFGIEPSTKAAFDRHTELTAIPADPRFDFVVATHVLEHLTNPGEILDALGSATRPGGWIYLSVPNVDRLPEHRDWRYILNANAHIAAYTLDCLRVLLGRAGFGGATLVTMPKDTKKNAKRLRVVARRGAPAMPVAHPLDAALEALRLMGSASPTRSDSRLVAEPPG